MHSGGDGREERAMFTSCEYFDRDGTPPLARARSESQPAATVYASPVAVAVFFAILHAGYSPSRALQLSGIGPTFSCNPTATGGVL
jgi:hypothetical protein